MACLAPAVKHNHFLLEKLKKNVVSESKAKAAQNGDKLVVEIAVEQLQLQDFSDGQTFEDELHPRPLIQFLLKLSLFWLGNKISHFKIN